ncbi:hypothetical protein [Candidatus Williamhamiltonella defendens]|uniref:hypothetical protein n=1 Tax=Candidatus Williamhamiltonella defendens TaxID=138072 RepID=UPI0013143914|nr:hypothetical protein [Candidatus Hamiltonella defensa]
MTTSFSAILRIADTDLLKSRRHYSDNRHLYQHWMFSESGRPENGERGKMMTENFGVGHRPKDDFLIKT